MEIKLELCVQEVHLWINGPLRYRVTCPVTGVSHTSNDLTIAVEHCVGMALADAGPHGRPKALNYRILGPTDGKVRVDIWPKGEAMTIKEKDLGALRHMAQELKLPGSSLEGSDFEVLVNVLNECCTTARALRDLGIGAAKIRQHYVEKLRDQWRRGLIDERHLKAQGLTIKDVFPHLA